MGNHKGCPYGLYLVARSLCLWDLSDDLGRSGFASMDNHKGCPYGLYLVGITLVVVECVTRDRNV